MEPGPTSGRVVQALGPVEQLRAGRLGRRLPQLAVGLLLYGVSGAIVIRAGLGNVPWDVLHQGVARRLSADFGVVTVAVSVLVLLLWIPLRERPGLGTLANVVVVGLAVDLGLALVSAPGSWWARTALMVLGIVLQALATALYIGSQFGPGPRDGLMTGLHRRTGLSVRVVRTSIEATVVVAGFLFGGVFGVGTLLYAVAIGPLVQVLLPRFTVVLPTRARCGRCGGV